MKTADPVMQEVWRAKEANAKNHQNLSDYMRFLRKQSKRTHPGGHVTALGSTKHLSPASDASLSDRRRFEALSARVSDVEAKPGARK